MTLLLLIYIDRNGTTALQSYAEIATTVLPPRRRYHTLSYHVDCVILAQSRLISDRAVFREACSELTRAGSCHFLAFKAATGVRTGHQGDGGWAAAALLPGLPGEGAERGEAQAQGGADALHAALLHVQYLRPAAVLLGSCHAEAARCR